MNSSDNLIRSRISHPHSRVNISHHENIGVRLGPQLSCSLRCQEIDRHEVRHMHHNRGLANHSCLRVPFFLFTPLPASTSTSTSSSSLPPPSSLSSSSSPGSFAGAATGFREFLQRFVLRLIIGYQVRNVILATPNSPKGGPAEKHS